MPFVTPSGLRSYLAALRAAFTGFRVEREQIVVDACIWLLASPSPGYAPGSSPTRRPGRCRPTAGRSPGRSSTLPLQPGRPGAEERVQADNRDLLEKMGAPSA
jgi:hypothetical protein